MTCPTPSIGDIMMLSQLAWKSECAFRSARAGAPADFIKVETELGRLTKSITSLAQAVDEDDCLIARADENTKEVLGSTLGFCGQVLDDLESFISQYQEIKRPNGAGWFAGQRTWKQIFVRNYKNVWWTSEGGDLDALVELLAIHSQSIRLMKQALRSQSLWHFEETVEAVADMVSHKPQGDIDVKIVELHRMMYSMDSQDDAPRNDSPILWPSKDTPAPETGMGSAKRFNLPPVEPIMAARPLAGTPTRKEVPDLTWSEHSSPTSFRGSEEIATSVTGRRKSRVIPTKQSRRTSKALPRPEMRRRASSVSSRKVRSSHPPDSSIKLYKSLQSSRSVPELRYAPPSIPLPPLPVKSSYLDAMLVGSESYDRPPTPPAKDYPTVQSADMNASTGPDVVKHWEGIREEHRESKDSAKSSHSSEMPPSSLRRNQTKKDHGGKWWRWRNAAK